MNTFSTVLTFQSLKQAYRDRLLVYYQGGTWEASPEFVAWVYLHSQLNTQALIAVDVVGQPVEITNVSDFFQLLNNHLNAENIKYFGDYINLQNQINKEWRALKDSEFEKSK
jgi:hypothetical protein